MSRLACWAVVLGLFSGAWCVAQEVEVVQGSGERVVPAEPVGDSHRELIATPESELILTVIPHIIIEEEETELGGLGGGRATSYYRSYPSSPLQAANAQRQQLIQSLQALQDTYCRNAQLDEALAVREMIRQLQAQATAAGSLPEPVVTPPTGVVESPYVEIPYVYDLRGQNGKTFYRRVTGSVDGYVWGGENNVYTDDSILATAAVHAGVLKAGETGMVRLTILAGKDSYVGSTRNGVTTRPYQSYGGSFCIDGAGQELTTAYELRGQDKPPFAVYVVGRTDGSVYGTGSYTDDSDIATAAVHAGLLKVGEAGFVMVTLEGGKSAYESSTQNGVTTYDYGSWGGGYRLSAFQPVIKYGGQSFSLDVF